MTYERQYLLSDQEREERLRERVRELEAALRAIACGGSRDRMVRIAEEQLGLAPTASASNLQTSGVATPRREPEIPNQPGASAAGVQHAAGESSHSDGQRGAGLPSTADSDGSVCGHRSSEEVWTEEEIAQVKEDAKELEAVLGPDPTKVQRGSDPARCREDANSTQTPRTSEARICVYCGNPYGNGHSNRCAVTRLGWEESWSSSMHRPADASEVAQARVDEILAAHTPEPTGKRHLEPRPAEPVPDEFWRTQLDARERIGYLRGRQEATAELARDAMAQRPNEALNDRRDPNGQVHADGSSRGSGDPNHGRGGLVSADPGQRVDDARALPREHGQADGQRLDQVDGGPVASAGRLDGAIDRPDYPRSTCRHDREATVSVIDPRALGASAMVRQDLARWCGACGAFFYGGRWQAPQPRSETPIPMILYCPECSSIHVDEGEWTTRPHKTHQCQTCWNEWRPANVPTVGVKALETGGTGGGA